MEEGWEPVKESEIVGIEAENITASEAIELLPIVLIASILVICFSWFLSLFGIVLNEKKDKTLKQQQREYKKMERKIMKGL